MREKALKILHFSDMHVSIPMHRIKWNKWFSKRAIGAANLARGRSKYFDDAEMKMKALVEFKEKHAIDIVINSGDYTALGLKDELQLAKSLVAPLMHPARNYITVPGNHDIYVYNKQSHKQFLKEFHTVLHSDLPEYRQKSDWPLVRLIDDDLAIIAINSSKANIRPWKSSGFISTEQLNALERLLSYKRLSGRFIFIVTHYAARLANGKDDTRLHGLINADEFLQSCKDLQSGAILCGHIHKRYRVIPREINIPIYCAGSATMKGCEGGWIYEFNGTDIKSIPYQWDGKRYYTLIS